MVTLTITYKLDYRGNCRFISAFGVEANLYMKITHFALDSCSLTQTLCIVVFIHCCCIYTSVDKKGIHGQKLHREDAQKDQFKRSNHTLKACDNDKGRY